MNTIVQQQFITLECANCACLFGMTKDFQERRIADNEIFYCLRGHQNNYRGESEAQRLQKLLAQETSRRADAEAKFNKVGRKLKRLEKGVCSECNRTFLNLQAHMKTQHHHAKK